MHYRYVFSELPYAAVLCPAYEKSYCSSCMSDVGKIEGDTDERKIECECDRIVYCSSTCLENDRLLHRAECEAFRRPGAEETRYKEDYITRLVGRIVARYRLDAGVASLSTDFPTSMFKNRKLDDLMTHKREMRRSRAHWRMFERTCEQFYEFFDGTELASTPKWMVEKFFWRQRINGFSVVAEVRDGSTSSTQESIGGGLYLNASRFDHSCVSNGQYRFEGNRIVIECEIDDKDRDYRIDIRQPIQLSKKQWKNLRVDYGSSSFTYMMATSDERRRSLRARYFFECRCPLCSNARYNRMQVDSSPIECETCRRPFVWKRGRLFGGIKLAKECDCDSKLTNDDRVAMFGKDAGKEVKRLLKMWDRIVAIPPKRQKTKRQQRETKTGVAEFKESCRVLEDGSIKYWHPTINLRRAQFNELFYKLNKSSWVVDNFDNDHHRIRFFMGTAGDLDDLIRYAESSMLIYTHYLNCSSALQLVAMDLVEMYKTRSSHDDLARSGDVDRMNFWIKYLMKTEETNPVVLEAVLRAIRADVREWIMEDRRGAIEEEGGKK